jgi:hypothetical protein
MYNNEKNHYQGLFAWKPDNVQHGVWGSTENHHRTFGPDVQVHKDWYGAVTKIERGWF